MIFRLYSKRFRWGLDSILSHHDPQIIIDKSEAIVLMHNDKRFQNLNFNDVKVFDPGEFSVLKSLYLKQIINFLDHGVF